MGVGLSLLLLDDPFDGAIRFGCRIADSLLCVWGKNSVSLAQDDAEAAPFFRPLRQLADAADRVEVGALLFNGS